MLTLRPIAVSSFTRQSTVTIKLKSIQAIAKRMTPAISRACAEDGGLVSFSYCTAPTMTSTIALAMIRCITTWRDQPKRNGRFCL